MSIRSSYFMNFLTDFRKTYDIAETDMHNIESRYEKLEDSIKNKLNKLSEPLVESNKQLEDLHYNPLVKDSLLDSNLLNSIKLLQYNILFDFMLKNIKDCSVEIGNLYKDFNSKFQEENKLYTDKIRKKLYTLEGMYIDPNLPVPDKISIVIEHVGNVLNTINIRLDEDINTVNDLRDLLLKNKIRKLVSILNSNIFLKVLSILSTFKASSSDQILPDLSRSESTESISLVYDKSIFNKYPHIYKLHKIISEYSGSIDFTQVINSFFITWDPSTQMNQHIIKMSEILGLKKYIERDTYIYKTYFTESNKSAIFVYQFINAIISISSKNPEKLNEILKDNMLPVILIKFIKDIGYKVINYITYNSIFNDKKEEITKIYNDLMKSYKHIFSYVKLNKYDRIENKRIQTNILDNNSVLKLEYRNTQQRNSAIDNESKFDDTFYFGRFDKVFNTNEPYSDIADKLYSDLEKRIKNFEDICIIGYGQSGSGKTTTLLKGIGEQQGVLKQLLGKIEGVTNYELKVIELVANPHNLPSSKEQSKIDTYYKRKDLIQLYQTISFLPKTGNNVNDITHIIDGKFELISKQLNIPNEITETQIRDNDIKEFNSSFKEINLPPPVRYAVPSDKKITYNYDRTVNNFIKGDNYITFEDNNRTKIRYETSAGINTHLIKVDTNENTLLGMKANISDFNTLTGNLDETIDNIYNVIKYRYERPTSNNANSSRSHLIIPITVTVGGRKFTIILCDFAGVENEFDCTDPYIKELFFQGYKNTTLETPSADVITDEINKLTRAGTNTVSRHCKDSLNKNSLRDIGGECTENITYRINELCNTRKKEGFLINQTLLDLRTDISNFIKSVISKSLDKDSRTGAGVSRRSEDNLHLPIFTDNDIYPYCRNINIEQNYFETFYDYSAESMNPTGIINQTFKELLGEKYDKLIIILFTVVLLNVKTGKELNKDYNNPPSVPYININKLIYYVETNADNDKIRDELGKILLEMNKFAFYTTGGDSSIIRRYSIDNIDRLISEVKQFNASTLIGSIETATMLQNLTFNKFSCLRDDDRLMKDETIQLLEEVGMLPNLDVENKYYSKYLNYRK